LVSIDGETRLRVDAHVEYDMTIWPTGQDMFFDMTTEVEVGDEAPMWTSSAPTEGEIMPIADDGVSYFLSTSQMSAWATDDQGAPLISCTGASGWSMTSDGDGLSADAPNGQDSTTITCHATDSAGQTTDTRNYTLQVPLRATATASGNTASVTMTPTAEMPSMNAVVTLVQDDAQTSSDSVSLNGETTVSVDLDSLSPGPFMVRISASGTGMADFAHTYDMGTSKESSPPTITVWESPESFWNEGDGTYFIKGQFADGDGDAVTISATNNGNVWGNTITPTGLTWEMENPGTPGADMNTIVLTICDSWGKCTSITHEAGATPSNEPSTPPPTSDSSSEDGGGLPGFGLFAALGAIALAGLRQHRRD
jgi:MYXO-CTERM domain-containing protein